MTLTEEQEELLEHCHTLTGRCKPWRWGHQMEWLSVDFKGKNYKVSAFYHSQEGIQDLLVQEIGI